MKSVAIPMQKFLKRLVIVIIVLICSNAKAQSFTLKGHIEGKDTGLVVDE